MKRLLLAFILVPMLACTAPYIAHAADSGTSFISLTNIPGIDSVGNSGDLSAFLNNIYKICVGLAAVLAVLQLVLAGIEYMGGDSFTEKKAARERIVMTFVGLLLVLAPTIVFGIINPDILDLKIHGLNDLQVTNAPVQATQTNAGSPNSVSECSPPCANGQVCSNNQCVSAASNDATCAQWPVIQLASKATTCPAGETRIPDACCSVDQQTQCCGSRTAPSSPSPATPGNTPAPAPQYGWRGVVTNPDGSGRNTAQQGPFATQAQCQQSITTYMQKNNLVTDGTFQCNCNVPLSHQTNCSF